MEATGQADGWRVKVRFSERDKLSRFHTHFKEKGGVTLEQLISPIEPHNRTFNMTAKYHKALVATYNTGCYDTPLETTATELAKEFGLSQQAFSERLHRGVSELIENTLITG